MIQRTAAILAVILCLLGAVLPVCAAEVDCDTVYCFTQEDFGAETESITGICITKLPDPAMGTVKLGTRVIRSGDILTADQAAKLTFCPLQTRHDAKATLWYLPVYENRVEKETALTISIRGKEDKAPAAEDLAMETYKNLPNTQKLKAMDPEGKELTYTVIRQPRRGQVSIRPDGTCTYTPKKNKIGVDSFTFTATDPAGNVSREATVTITILKPSQSTLYTDTIGHECRFEAEWMKNSGIFSGETLAGNLCFQPDRVVTRGEFVTMLVKALELPEEELPVCDEFADIPIWLRPYMAAAMRAGLFSGLPGGEIFDTGKPVTAPEAAVMLQNALGLPREDAAAFAQDSLTPVWARDAVAALAGKDLQVGDGELTRGQAAKLLYQAMSLSEDAPGMAVIRAGRR